MKNDRWQVFYVSSLWYPPSVPASTYAPPPPPFPIPPVSFFDAFGNAVQRLTVQRLAESTSPYIIKRGAREDDA